nr:hypothetical protein [uncultured Prevotella sp.]
MTTLTAQGHLVVTRQRNGTSVTVSSIKVTYQGGTSGSEAPTGTWSTAIPSVSEGEYLWTRTVTTFSDGTSSTAYSSAYQGTNGLAGMISRVTEWASGFEYHNDEAMTSGTRNLDFCTVTTSATSFKMYKCLKTHTSSSDILPTNTEYWQEMNSMVPIYTPMIIAAGALFRFTQTNQILVMKSDGETVAAGMGGGDYPLWVGASTPASAPFRVTIDGKMYSTNAVIAGVLQGVSGTFKSLQCVDSDGNITGEIAFGEQSGIYFNSCDTHQQGTVDSRYLRHYAADIRCRGLLGVHQHSVAVITGSSIKYYVNGDDMSSYVTKTMSTVSSSDGHTVYKVPVYPSTGDSATGNCKVEDTNGFPVDVILINNTSGTYYYELDGGIAGKTVTIANVNDQLNSIYIANNNAWRTINGGAVHQYLNIGAYRSPSISTSTIGYDWICISAFDNDWS